MKKIFQKFVGVVFGKPTKCPSCKGSSFHLDHTGPYGENYWKCDKCGYMIKD